MTAALLTLGGCETANGVNEGPVEYATRPDYRDVERQPARQDGDRRYERGEYDRYRPNRDPYAEPFPPRRAYDPAYDRY